MDVLVHSAGVVELGPLAEPSAETWRRTFELNVVAAAELPGLRSLDLLARYEPDPRATRTAPYELVDDVQQKDAMQDGVESN